MAFVLLFFFTALIILNVAFVLISYDADALQGIGLARQVLSGGRWVARSGGHGRVDLARANQLRANASGSLGNASAPAM